MSNGNNNGHSTNGAHKDTAIVARNSNGQKPDAAVIDAHDPASSGGLALLWDGLSPAVTQKLDQPLDSSLVSQRRGRGGRTFDYLEGHVVINQANRIFGFGGWGYELVGDVTPREVETVDSQTGEVKTSLGYSASVRVTVAGALPRTDVGVHPVTEDNFEGHDTAMKGAVTDGMKRAFRSLGVQFGNGFYGDQAPSSDSAQPQRTPARARANDGPQSPQTQARNRSESQEGSKDPVRQAQGSPSTGSKGGRSESQAEKLRNRIFKMAAEQGFDEDGVRTAVVDRTGKSIDDLTADELRPLVEAAANRLNQMRQAQQAE